MRWKQVFGALVGGAVVFVACAGQQAGTPPGAADGGLDALTDAVGEVLRDTLGLDVEPAKDADASPTTDDFAAGTRIKPRFRSSSFADGAKGKVFVGWWDSGKNVACAPKAASDGKLRCLPENPAFVTESSATQPLYADSSCTIPAFSVLATGTCAPPTLVIRTIRQDWCASTSTVFKVTKMAVDPPRLYQKYPASGCTEWSGIASTVYEGVEVPASEFVEVTETVSP